jgi:hypothetical protein
VPPVTRTFILAFVRLGGMQRGAPIDALRSNNPI